LGVTILLVEQNVELALDIACACMPDQARWFVTLPQASGWPQRDQGTLLPSVIRRCRIAARRGIGQKTGFRS
jgi:hypothetical protein